MNKPIWTDTEWTFPLIDRAYEEIEKIAVKELGLEGCYPNKLEIISAEQMLDAYSSIGMPVFYRHWSFGKSFTHNKKMYDHGMQGLAYEIVINSDPCIAYLMEGNTMTMQALVIAHASFGHNYFFAKNATFKHWTDASSIIDYLDFAKNYILKCEEREGQTEVELFLDSCHAMMDYGVNRYKRPGKLSLVKEKLRQKDREEFERNRVDHMYDLLIKKEITPSPEIFPREPEENILYFCEKNSPDLPMWKREILRIIRKISQYFYPQGQTKVMNEGCATYVHYQIMNRLHELGLMNDSAMYEFLHSHTGVTFQPHFDDKRYSGINPYAIGFAMMKDIKRICEQPSDEDKKWFPYIAGKQNGMEVLRDAWANFRDESFIRQYLSPKVIRDFKLFRLKDNHKEPEILVTAIHNDRGFESIREALADQHEEHNRTPQLEVFKVDPKTRVMYIRYKPFRGRALANIPTMLKHIQVLWSGFPVVLIDDKGTELGKVGDCR